MLYRFTLMIMVSKSILTMTGKRPQGHSVLKAIIFLALLLLMECTQSSSSSICNNKLKGFSLILSRKLMSQPTVWLFHIIEKNWVRKNTEWIILI